MKLIRTLVILAGTIPLVSGANKEMVELQRDMALLQDQVRQMNEKLVVLTTLMQTALDNTSRSNASIVSMQERMTESLKLQGQNVVGPVAAVGTKLDQMSEDFRAVRENVLDMNSRMGKLDAKITDLQNAVQVLKSPPPPPAPVVLPQDQGPAPSAPGGKPATPPAGMQAEATYTNAYRDYVGGNYDLAMTEFTDYLKYFSTTQFAPNAQYYIGDIFYKRKEYDNAIIAFDAVLEHFSDNNKTPDAHLMKGRSLLALGKRDAASREFKEITARYPDSDASAKAKSLLKELGLSSGSAAPSAAPKPKARKKR